MADLTITSPADFAATTIEIAATSAAGRQFFSEVAGLGAAAVSAVFRKSGGLELLTAAEAAGLKVEQATGWACAACGAPSDPKSCPCGD